MSDKHSVTDAPVQVPPAESALSISQLFNFQATTNMPAILFMLVFFSVVIILWGVLLLFQVKTIRTELVSNSYQQQFWLLCHGGATDEERKVAFLGLLKAGNTEWRSANLKNLDLSELDLPRIQVENANFENSSLAGSNLANSEFSFSQFQLVDFTDADLSSSNLIESYLLKTVLNNTNFTNASLHNAMIEQVTAHQTNFQQADLSEAHMLLADLTDSNFRGADMTLVNLEAATLEGCDLYGANLEGALLLDADFTDSNWWRALGLGSDVIEDLFRSFPPTSEIKPEWEEDFKNWLTEYTATKEETTNDKTKP